MYKSPVRNLARLNEPLANAAFSCKRWEYSSDHTKSENLSSAEWNEILALRYESFQPTGKFSNLTSAKDMQDSFDTFSEHFICKLDGRIVAAARIVFVEGERSRSENIQLGAPVPEWIWSRNFVEASRGCSDFRIRGSGLYTKLIQFLGTVASGYGYEYVLGNSNPNHLELYRKIGFSKVGECFEAFGTDSCNLILWALKS